MKFVKTSNKFDDVKIFQGKLFQDSRGQFSKPFFGDILKNEFEGVSEVLYSKSTKNTIRGLHFQLPPYDVHKLVHCLDGEINDVFIDLRVDSKNYGNHESIKLNSSDPISLLIPKGFGHGFSVLSQSATVLYLQSGPFNDEHDSGIFYDSIGLDWQIDEPILSDKDKSLVSFEDFISPWK
tara:strand:- start:317 stop:856 length:540 start_codon:yes stop_codon:yes gene_type:complete